MMNNARAFAALIPPLLQIDDCSCLGVVGSGARARMYERVPPRLLSTGAACTSSRLVNTCFPRALLV
jgi:hypothetical protein